MRSMFLKVSEYQSRSFRPKVVGSAWTPWVRPMVGVCLNSTARLFSTSASFWRPSRRTAEACFSCTLRPVSFTSVEVRPIWMYLASSPTCSPTLVRKAIMSWLISLSISWMRSTSKSAFALMTSTASFGMRPSSALASQAAISTFSMVCHSFRSFQIFSMTGLVYLGIICQISPFGFPMRAQISRPTTTPAAEACARPLVMPAPSPIAKKFGIFVSSWFESSMREE